jgi:hypothetical protein
MHVCAFDGLYALAYSDFMRASVCVVACVLDQLCLFSNYRDFSRSSAIESSQRKKCCDLKILTKTKEKEQMPACLLFLLFLFFAASILFSSFYLSVFFLLVLMVCYSLYFPFFFFTEAARVAEEQEQLLKDLEEKAAEEAEKLAKAQAAAEAGIDLEGKMFGIALLITLIVFFLRNFVALYTLSLSLSHIHLHM